MAGSDDHLQNHDVQVLVKGLNVPVFVDAALSASTWRGGLWVMYSANTFGTPPSQFKNIRVVSQSTGDYAVGFIMRPSEFHPQVQTPGSPNLRVSEYNFSSYQPTKTSAVTMMLDGSFIFKMYEQYAFPNRTSGTALTYNLNDDVYVSERGYITTYADAIAAGIANPIWAGTVWLTPSADNEYRIGIDRY